MTWIKICGMTNLEDAQLAAEAGADAVGFVFYEKSPRSIDPETAREIVARLPTKIGKVGVFVSQGVDQIIEMSKRAKLTAIQLHPSDESTGKGVIEDLIKRFSLTLFVAVPGRMLAGEEGSGFFFSREFLSRASAIFLDSGTPQQPGGTGTVFDWQKVAPAARLLSQSIPIVVAGGLSNANVGDAIRTLRPWGVDVASGVEREPGKKDPEKVHAFVRAVREAEKNQ
jgi:phosphoribosylanthranilate isomerase